MRTEVGVDDKSKKGCRRHETEITEEVIEAGLGSPNFKGPWEEKLPKDMLPAAIRSILAVTRVVRDRHPELPQFVVAEDESSRYLS